MIRRPPRSTLFPYTTALPICHPLGEDAVDVHPDDAQAILLRLLSTTKREPAGDTTTTDPRSRRIRAGRRGGHVTSSSSRLVSLWAACPHSRAPGAPCPGWSHHSPAPVGTGRTSRHRHLHAR